ncbi:hypothetical protein QW060_25975 [Myroides ceti]|uniref:Uncharacterized protein n=1 Tax=Paenimyroides ceti TaxID=395087 RepID=A0ABT8D0A7_9FLAO|nr:hypothetical protein [Paenimyroides ceti]MDN3710283.1 hypothetical protein [Paenimyroides ceti]
MKTNCAFPSTGIFAMTFSTALMVAFSIPKCLTEAAMASSSVTEAVVFNSLN